MFNYVNFFYIFAFISVVPRLKKFLKIVKKDNTFLKILKDPKILFPEKFQT